MKKKIAIFTTTRSDVSILTPLMKRIQKTRRLDYLFFVGGTHLNKTYGNTLNELRNNRLKVHGHFNYLDKGDNKRNLSKSLATAHQKVNEIFSKHQFDIVCILGDRFEKLAIVNNAIIYNKPIFHLHGGEITEGAIDNQIRNMISKSSQLHFVICNEYKKNLIKIGEKKNNIFNYGSLAVDAIQNIKIIKREILFKKLNLDHKLSTVILTYHPVTLENKISSANQIKNVLKILNKSNFQVVITAPGHENERSIMEKYIYLYSRNNHKIKYIKSLGHNLLFNLIPQCEFMIGNSSSGLIEVPYFKIPTVNIGDRQKGRVMHKSIINCSYSSSSIQKAINKAMSPKFKKKIIKQKYLFGNGGSSKKIVNKILTIRIDQEFLRKKK